MSRGKTALLEAVMVKSSNEKAAMGAAHFLRTSVFPKFIGGISEIAPCISLELIMHGEGKERGASPKMSQGLVCC